MVPATVAPHAAPAWILRAVTHVPGVLQLADGHLSFRSTRRVVFDVDLRDAVASGLLTVPRLRPAGVFDLVVDGERLRVHLTRPPGTTPPSADLLRATASAVPISPEVWRLLLDGVRPTDRRARAAVAPVRGGHRRLRSPRWRPAPARPASAGPTPRS